MQYELNNLVPEYSKTDNRSDQMPHSPAKKKQDNSQQLIRSAIFYLLLLLLCFSRLEEGTHKIQIN